MSYSHQWWGGFDPAKVLLMSSIKLGRLTRLPVTTGAKVDSCTRLRRAIRAMPRHGRKNMAAMESGCQRQGGRKKGR